MLYWNGCRVSASDEVPADEILKRVFDILVREARTNPKLSKKLIEAFPAALITKIDTRPRKKKTFDPAQYHAVNILRKHGENVLRGKLEQIRNRENLKAIARASGLTLDGAAAKPSASIRDLAEGIVRAALHYDKQRSAAGF